MEDIPPVRHHKHRYHRRRSQIATCLFSTIIYFHSSSACGKGGVGVDALPRDRNNKKDLPATNSLNALHRRNHGSGRRTSSVVLNDSFPCESAADQQQEHRPEQELQGVSPSTGSNSNTGGGAASPTTPEIGTVGNNDNSSNGNGSEINPLGTRGGGAEQACQMTSDFPSLLLNDDMLDQLVEELINATSTEEPIVEDGDDDDNKESDHDAIVDGRDGAIDQQSNTCLSNIDTKPTKRNVVSGTIPSVMQWIRARLLSIYQSIFAMCRKLQKLCMMQQQTCDADSIARMRFEQQNNIMNDGSCTNQQYKHSKRSLSSVLSKSSHCRRSAFEEQPAAKMQKRFTFHVLLNNNAPTSTKQGRANSHSRSATNSKLSRAKLSSGTSPLKQIDQKTPRPRMDIAQLQSKLMQQKSSSILFPAEKPNIKAPPMQLLNKVKGRLNTKSEDK
ncbi:hypothetical protein ACHAXH_000752 [Discostella pseudostelligera]